MTKPIRQQTKKILLSVIVDDYEKVKKILPRNCFSLWVRQQMTLLILEDETVDK